MLNGTGRVSEKRWLAGESYKKVALLAEERQAPALSFPHFLSKISL
jgi:hypothetical protein